MNSELKRKTSMVLHQIEEALGNFVLKNGTIDSIDIKTLENIHKREVDKGRGFKSHTIKDIVEATYLDELFQLALDLAKDNSVLDSIKYLYALFHHLDIFAVRNAISHPNRPFWDCYWYRVAAIATDPVNEILGLQDIKKSFLAAEAGSIQNPPDEWFNKIIWQIPNNLPSRFDHGVTGLIGRTVEISALKKLISNQRANTIALVAPGGIGKTALALDFLNTVVSTPAYSNHVDAVIYITLKTEKLTTDGVVSLDAIETISELKTNIVNSVNEIFDQENSTFEETIKFNESRKLLLCIDNLETLLRDEHSCFEELNHSLPANWKVLLTSRVVVTNATILSLNVLKDKSAIHLARTYIKNRGANPLEEEVYSKLTEKCKYNPLAIRLTLDLVIKGKPIPDSLNVANKEIAEFSYNNLIETLNTSSIEILEALFVENQSSRISLCELLGLSMDEISASIGELGRTSLVKRESTDQGEQYSLSESVRELLLVNPRNIDARNKVQQHINTRRDLSKQIDIRQEQKDFPVWHFSYLPKGINENLKILITEVNKRIKSAHKNTEIAISLYKKLQDAEYIHESSSIYHRAYAKVSEALKDFNGAESRYKKAISLDPNDVQSHYSLAKLYHRTKRFDDSSDIYQKLIDNGWAREDESIQKFGTSIYDGYFQALLYSGRYVEVLEKTKKWKDSQNYRGILGAYRARAWKHKIENIVDSDSDGTIDALVRASRILSDVFTHDGYLRIACAQAKKVFEEIEYCFSRDDFCIKYQKEGTELLYVISEHVLEIYEVLNNFDSGLIEKLSKINIDDNPFISIRWKAFSTTDNNEEILSSNDVNDRIAVKIYSRPKNRASFLFARDAYDESYFLHYDRLKNGTWQEWCKLSLYARLEIVAEVTNPNSDKAIRATEIYFSE